MSSFFKSDTAPQPVPVNGVSTIRSLPYASHTQDDKVLLVFIWLELLLWVAQIPYTIAQICDTTNGGEIGQPPDPPQSSKSLRLLDDRFGDNSSSRSYLICVSAAKALSEIRFLEK